MPIYHRLSESKEAFSDQETGSIVTNLLLELNNPNTPFALRVKLVELSGEKTCSHFNKHFGLFLECFLGLVHESFVGILDDQKGPNTRSDYVLLLEATLRALLSICCSSSKESQPHMIRELTDVFLQVAHICDVVSQETTHCSSLSRMSAAISKILQKIPQVNFESVLLKLVHWINTTSRHEEHDDQIKDAEAQFAGKQLTKMIKDQLLHLNYQCTEEKTQVVRENMLKFFIHILNSKNYIASSEAIRIIWVHGVRRPDLLDEFGVKLLIENSMRSIAHAAGTGLANNDVSKQVVSANIALFEIIILEAGISRRLDAGVVMPYVIAVLRYSGYDFMQGYSESFLRRSDVQRLCKVLCILLAESGKFDSTDVLEVATGIYPLIYGALDHHLASGTIDTFYLEVLLGLFLALYNGCSINQQAFENCEKMSTNYEFSNSLQKIRGILLSIQDTLASKKFKEGLYSSKRKGKQTSATVSHSWATRQSLFARSCILLHEMVACILEPLSNPPRTFCFSWETQEETKQPLEKLQEPSITKKKRLWIPTGITENLKRHVLQ